MTGRDLIIYICENNLENEEVFSDATFFGFITVTQAAEKMNVGIETVYQWIFQNRLEHMHIGDMYLVLPNEKFKVIDRKE